MIRVPVNTIPVGCKALSVTVFANMAKWEFLSASHGEVYSITTESDVVVEKAGQLIETVESSSNPRIGDGARAFAHDVTGFAVENDGTMVVSLTGGWRLRFSTDHEDENRLFIRKLVYT